MPKHFNSKEELEREDLWALVEGKKYADEHTPNKWIWDHAYKQDLEPRSYAVTFRNFDHSEELTLQLAYGRGLCGVSHRYTRSNSNP